MEYLYAVLLLNSGKKDINENSISKIIESTGEKVDMAKVRMIIDSIEGKNIDEILSTAVVTNATSTQAPKIEEKKEEAPAEKEISEEEAQEGLSSLFG